MWIWKGGPFQTRFLTVFKFKNELSHWTRLSLLMKIEWSFVKFGPRVPLFWVSLGYFGQILAILNMAPFLSRWKFLNEFYCKVVIFLYPSDICIIILPYCVPLWLLTSLSMLKYVLNRPKWSFLSMFRGVYSHKRYTVRQHNDTYIRRVQKYHDFTEKFVQTFSSGKKWRLIQNGQNLPNIA